MQRPNAPNTQCPKSTPCQEAANHPQTQRKNHGSHQLEVNIGSNSIAAGTKTKLLSFEGDSSNMTQLEIEFGLPLFQVEYDDNPNNLPAAPPREQEEEDGMSL